MKTRKTAGVINYMNKGNPETELDPWESPFKPKEDFVAFGILESLDNAKGTGCPNCLAVVQRLAVRGNIEGAVSLAQLSMRHHVCPIDKDICK